VQTLEALKLFLDTPDCVFVLGADTKIVQTAIEAHYKNVNITGESAKDYLEKIIQLRFDLPPILDDAMEKHLRSQGVNDAMLNRWRALVAAAEVNPRRDRDDFICWQALMHAAPASFARQVLDFEDKAIRFGFVQDALKWQKGTQEEKDGVKGFFNAYEDRDAKRLRGVLRQISFSKEFSPDAPDSMIYMTAPPIVVKPEPEKQPEKQVIEMVSSVEEAVEAVTRGAKAAPLGDQNRRTIGGLEFVRVPKGSFVMGSKNDNELASDDEKPQHTVDITYDFWMAKFILTNRHFGEFAKVTSYRTTAEEKGSGYTNDGTGWKDVKGADWKHPLGPKGDLKEKNDHPVVIVSWDDAMAYCKWFNEAFKSDLGDLLLHLPSEAEWEKAARGAYGNEWPWGSEFDLNKCNSAEGKVGGTTSVGAYSAVGGDSPYGCADMVGNVWEWCADWFNDSEYKKRASGSVVDPRGPQSGASRVLRGGSFRSGRDLARCAYRSYYDPDSRNYYLGFRVCASPPSHI
jgi:sulfatase modifying factor 1